MKQAKGISKVIVCSDGGVLAPPTQLPRFFRIPNSLVGFAFAGCFAREGVAMLDPLCPFPFGNLRRASPPFQRTEMGESKKRIFIYAKYSPSPNPTPDYLSASQISMSDLGRDGEGSFQTVVE